jgi:hypothetical protein
MALRPCPAAEPGRHLFVTDEGWAKCLMAALIGWTVCCSARLLFCSRALFSRPLWKDGVGGLKAAGLESISSTEGCWWIVPNHHSRTLPVIALHHGDQCDEKWNAPEGVTKPGRVQSGITIQRATGFPPLAPIPSNANSLEGQYPNES